MKQEKIIKSFPQWYGYFLRFYRMPNAKKAKCSGSLSNDERKMAT